MNFMKRISGLRVTVLAGLAATSLLTGCTETKAGKAKVSFRDAREQARQYMEKHDMTTADYTLVSKGITSTSRYVDPRYEWWTFKCVPREGVPAGQLSMIYVNSCTGRTTQKPPIR